MLLIVVLPDVATVPLQSPEPEQAVASVELQVSCVLPPIATDIGLALSVSVGAAGLDCVAAPPPHPARTSAAALREIEVRPRNMAKPRTADCVRSDIPVTSRRR